jgi:gliding motility-associated-like protein
LILDAPSPGTLELGPDGSVALGDSIQITPMWSGMVPLSWIWTPAVGSPDGSSFWVMPAQDLSLSAVVTDTAGCIYLDTVIIRVFEEARVYVPNVFSPNDDQLNDVFVITANDAGVTFVSLEIFDRWGGLLYGQYEGSPLAWDGRSGGQPALTGVYAWKLIYLTADNTRVVRYGDVTLMR